MVDEKMEMCEGGVSLVSSEVKAPPPARPNLFEKVFQPSLAELLGTMFFVFTGCVSVIENEGATGRLQPALVHGLAVAAMVACMAEIRSGSLQRIIDNGTTDHNQKNASYLPTMELLVLPL